MYHPTIFFDPLFVVSVIAGWMLTIAGALVLLVAAVWSVAAGEWLRGDPQPAAWRALCAVGVGVFVAGWLWQIIGYYRVGALTW